MDSRTADWKCQFAERQVFEEDDIDDEEVDADEVSMLHSHIAWHDSNNADMLRMTGHWLSVPPVSNLAACLCLHRMMLMRMI